MKRNALATAILALAGVFSSAPLASAQLNATIQETGAISISNDGNGDNNPTGGTLRVDKPAGALVRGAYLFAASNFNRVINNGDVTLNGVGLNWDATVFNGFPANPTFFCNTMDNVTSIVKPIVDAAPAGIVTIPVNEVSTTSIDGTVLSVIFDDPNVTASTTVILLYGGQLTNGDTFVINLAQPLNLSDPNAIARMGLGISFGFQGNSGSPMTSIIDVNGSRLTSSAGGEDDGQSANGALITAGGVGDSFSNPPPLAPSTSFSTDDELYDLLPFVNTGDTQITVSSLNPTDDDNIFCGFFVTSVPAAIGESILLSPVTASNTVGTNHTVTAKVVDDNNVAIVGRAVTIEVIAGPNAGNIGNGTTNALGEVSFSYAGTGGVGTDDIQARMINSAGAPQTSNTVNATWTAVPVVSLTCPPDFVEVFAAGPPTQIDPTHSGMATFQDDCDPNAVLSFTDTYAGPTVPCDYETLITRVWRLDDSCGNHLQCTQTITLLSPACAGSLDIAPATCPNVVNLPAGGTVEFVLVTGGSMDTTDINIPTLRLRRADGLGRQLVNMPLTIIDRTTPHYAPLGSCNIAPPDGRADIVLTVPVQHVKRAFLLGAMANGAQVPIELHGYLMDGRPFVLQDTLTVQH